MIATEAALAAALLLPVTVALGAAFPLGLALGASSGAAAATAARLYAVNTTGAIFGSLLAGFALIPAIGLRGTLLVGGGIACAASIAMMLGAAGPRRRVAAATIAAASVVSLAAAPRWNDALLSSGAYKVRALSADVGPARGAGGRHASVLPGRRGGHSLRPAVRRRPVACDRRQNRRVDRRRHAHAKTAGPPSASAFIQTRSSVAVVGLGSGVTAGAALTHPLERLEIIEISPEVVEASRLFDPYSGKPLSDPRTRLIVGDARTHFTLQRRDSSLYDVIISEPSNPWMAGVAALFTREFFEASSARLAPGGIICQWAHTYDISDADLRADRRHVPERVRGHDPLADW